MRVVLCAVLAVTFLTAAAVARDSRDVAPAENTVLDTRQEVAAVPPPPPNHFIPRPSELLQAFGNFLHQHHQDTAAAHHQSHAQHHVTAHGASLPPPPPPPPAVAGALAGAVAGAASGAAAGEAAAAAAAPPPPPGPQPPHVRPHLGSQIGSHLPGGGLHGLLSGSNAPVAPDNAVINTRTVFIEVTKRVTRHPVCMTVYGQRPPCLPYHEYHPSPYKKPVDDDGYRGGEEHMYRAEDEEYHWNDKVDYHIAPTAVVNMARASAAPESGFQGRAARYIEIRKPRPAEPAVAAPAAPAAPAASHVEPAKSDEAVVETPALVNAPTEVSMNDRQGPIGAIGAGFSQLASGMASMMPIGPIGGPKAPETKYEIKTLWVTKVERYTDYRVTATLVAENCIPTDSKIPFCNSGYQGPSYESGEEYSTYPTSKPPLYTTPKPPKPHHPPPHHKPPPPPPTPPPVNYKPVPAPDPAPYPAQVAYEKPAYTAPPPPAEYPAAPAPAPAYPVPAPAYPAPAPPAEYPAAPAPAPAPAYPAPAPPAYAPAPPPAPEYAPATYTAPPPPPPPTEPVYDYPSDALDHRHWTDNEKATAESNDANRGAGNSSA